MNTEGIFFEIVADTSRLEPVIDIFESIAKGDAAIGEQLARTSKKYQQQATEATNSAGKQAKGLQQISDAARSMDKVIAGGNAKQAMGELAKQLQLTGNELKKFYQQIAANARQKILDGGTVEQIKKFEAELTAANQFLKMFEEAEKKAATASTNLKTELRSLVAQLAQLEVQGKRNTAEYDELVARAGEVRDAIADANDAISNSGSDTRQLDNLVNVAGAVAGGFAVAQGAISLFGIENQEVQQVIAKTNAVMSILAGIQQIQDFLSKRQAASLGALLGIRRADTVAQVAETEATAANAAATTAATASTEALVAAETEQVVATEAATVATGQAAIATRVWNAVLDANPLFLLIGVITAAAAAIHIFSSNADDAAESQKKYNDALERGVELNNGFVAAIGKANDLTIADMGAAGATKKQIRDKELYFLGEQVKETEKFLNKNVAAYEAADDKLRAIGLRQIEADKDEIEQLDRTKNAYAQQQEKLYDLQDQYRIKTANNKKESNDEQAAADEKAAQKQEENNKKQKAINEKRLAADKEAAKKVLEIEAAADAELKKLRDAHYLAQFQDDTQRAIEKVVQETNTEEARINALKISEDKRRQLLTSLRQKEIDELAAIEKKRDDKDGKAEADRLEKLQTNSLAQIDRINATAYKQQLDALESLHKNKLISEEEYQKQLAKLTGDAAAYELFLLEQQRAAAQKYAEDIKAIFSTLSSGFQELYGIDASSVALSQLDDLAAKAFDVFTKIKDGTLTTQEGLQQLASAAIAGVGAVTNQIFKDQQTALQQNLADAISAINAARDQELAAENNTAQQKADIKARYDAKERVAKQKAYEDDKKAKIAQAILNGALAITNIFATVPKFDFGVSTYILAGIAAATTAAQVAIIKSQQVPRFRTGKAKGEAVPGSGLAIVDDGHFVEPILRADGSIEYASSPARNRLTYLHKNDQVFTSLDDFMKRFVMPKMAIPEYMPNLKVASLSHQQTAQTVDSFQTQKSQEGLQNVDMEKFAKLIAKELGAKIPAPKSVHVSVDKKGIHTISKEGNARTEYLNKRNSFY